MAAGFAAVAVVVDVAWVLGVLAKAALMGEAEKLRNDMRDELVSNWRAFLLAGMAAIVLRCVRSADLVSDRQARLRET